LVLTPIDMDSRPINGRGYEAIWPWRGNGISGTTCTKCIVDSDFPIRVIEKRSVGLSAATGRRWIRTRTNNASPISIGVVKFDRCKTVMYNSAAIGKIEGPAFGIPVRLDVSDGGGGSSNLQLKVGAIGRV